MMTEMVKEWLWRQVWQNATIAEKDNHICNGYDADQLDPAAIFNYQVKNSAFTVYHFVAHMVIMKNVLPWECYRPHRQWIFATQGQHIRAKKFSPHPVFFNKNIIYIYIKHSPLSHGGHIGYDIIL